MPVLQLTRYDYCHRCSSNPLGEGASKSMFFSDQICLMERLRQRVMCMPLIKKKKKKLQLYPRNTLALAWSSNNPEEAFKTSSKHKWKGQKVGGIIKQNEEINHNIRLFFSMPFFLPWYCLCKSMIWVLILWTPVLYPYQ